MWALTKGQLPALAIALVLASAARGAELTVTASDDRGEPLQHAVVSLHGDSLPTAEEPEEAIMDQRDRQFQPHVLAVREGTSVRFPNSDNIRHHVYSFSPAKRFELRLYHGTAADPVRFDRAGKVALGCNIHDTMLGYIYVLESGHFGVSGEAGEVRFDDLPGGDYRVRIRHPRLAEPIERPLTLAADQSETLAETLSPLEPDPRSDEPDSELESLFRQ